VNVYNQDIWWYCTTKAFNESREEVGYFSTKALQLKKHETKAALWMRRGVIFH